MQLINWLIVIISPLLVNSQCTISKSVSATDHLSNGLESSKLYNFWTNRTNDDDLWGKTYDKYVSAKKTLLHDPKNQKKKDDFDKAQNEFLGESSTHRGSIQSTKNISPESICSKTPVDATMQFASDDKKQTDDNRRKSDDLWTKSYDKWNKALQQLKSSQYDVNVKKNFMKETDIFNESSQKEKKSLQSWKNSTDKWNKERENWDNSKSNKNPSN